MRNAFAATAALLSLTLFFVSMVIGLFGLSPFGVHALPVFGFALLLLTLALVFRPRVRA